MSQPNSSISGGLILDVQTNEYAAQYRNELDGTPFDRKMVDWLIEQAAGLPGWQPAPSSRQ